MKKNNGRKGYVSFSVMHEEAMRDPGFRKAYDALGPKYELIHAILDARYKRGVTQAEIAERAGTTQSAIARFESGRANPTLDFAARVATAVGAKLEIRLVKAKAKAGVHVHANAKASRSA